MTESEAIRELRRDLGRRLAAARVEAGYTQREFAQRISYARSTLSTVESGVQRAGRSFWDACDRALKTGGTLARGYDRISGQRAAALQEAIELSRKTTGPTGALRAGTAADGLLAFRALGWPTAVHGSTAQLVTGTVLDALEVPQASGMLAASWWRCSGGMADEIRGLPELPDPLRAMAVIACAGRFYFLTAPDSCPWSGQELTAAPRHAQDAPLIGWHSAGSWIPAPPSADGDGHQATWAFLPSQDVELPCPVVLLDLLAKAAAATQHHPPALTLTGGVLAIPVIGPAPTLTQPADPSTAVRSV